MMIQYGILILFLLALFACILWGFSVIWALLLGYALFAGYALYRRNSPKEVLKVTWEGIRMVKNILLTFILIGMITALWRTAGTIPAIIYYAMRLFSPSLLLLASFLLCALVSVLTGTSLGTAATVGVICMMIGGGMGTDPALLGGAILSGSFFGDRCSPMSTSALLVADVTKTDIYRNIGNMIRTSAVPFLITCAVYIVLGRSQSGQSMGAAVVARFAEWFDLRLLTILPALAIVVLALFRVKVKLAMGISIGIALVISAAVQGAQPLWLLRTIVFGFRAGDPELAALLNGGGILSMKKAFAIVMISGSYAGLFRITGLLEGLRSRLVALSRVITPYGALLVTAVLTCIVACNQSLSIILTDQLCGDIIPDKDRMAAALEDTCVVIAALIPWSVACATPLATLSAPATALLAACYLYLLPLCHFWTGRFVRSEEE